jgi:hypothetical protein
MKRWILLALLPAMESNATVGAAMRIKARRGFVALRERCPASELMQSGPLRNPEL